MLVYINIPSVDGQALVALLNKRNITAWLEMIGNQPVIGVPVKDAEEVIETLREIFERKLEQILSDYDSFNKSKDLEGLYVFLHYNFKLKNYLAMRAAIDTSCLIGEKEYDELKKAIDTVMNLK